MAGYSIGKCNHIGGDFVIAIILCLNLRNTVVYLLFVFL